MDKIRFVAAKGRPIPESRASDYPHPKLTFVNIASPNEIKDARRQTKIRRHVMKKIGLSRRRGASVLTPGDSRAVSRPTPAFIPRMPQLCPYWQGIFLGLSLLDDNSMKLCLGDAAVEFAQTDDYRAQFLGHNNVVTTLVQYSKSIEIIRHSLCLFDEGGKVQATIGTIIGLAFYDVSRPCRTSHSPL